MKSLKSIISITLIINSLVLLLLISLVAYFSFFYHFSFNYEVEVNGQYYLTLIWPVVLVVVLLNAIRNKFRFTPTQFFYLIFVLLVLFFQLFSKYYDWGNEHFTVVCTIIAGTGLVLFLNKIKVVYLIFGALSLLTFYEQFLGLTQYLESKEFSNNISLDIKGTFQNSGVFSIYLVTQMPIIFFMISNFYIGKGFPSTLKKIKAFLFVVVCLISAFLIYHAQSRTAYISAALVAIVWFLHNYGAALKNAVCKISRYWIVLFAALFFLCLVAVAHQLFFIKKISAMGRLLKVHVTINHLHEHFWFGTGLGRFTWFYPQWQSEYFSNDNSYRSFYLSAGESYIVFNEPIQLLSEIGLFGFVFLSVLCVLFFCLKSKEYSGLINCLKVVVIGIICSSFTSYPMHVNFMIWLLFFCFFIGFSAARLTNFNWSYGRKLLTIKFLGRPFLFITIVFLLISSVHSFDIFKAFERWTSLRESLDSRMIALKEYEQLASMLDNDGKFLSNQGAALLSAGHPVRAAKCLEEASCYLLTKEIVHLRTRIFIELGHTEKAIRSQEWLCNFLPNKFIPKLELLKLYQHKKDSVSTYRVANTILNMEVKKQSPQVDEVKAIAKYALYNK